jgi:hypothetical protein
VEGCFGVDHPLFLAQRMQKIEKRCAVGESRELAAKTSLSARNRRWSTGREVANRDLPAGLVTAIVGSTANAAVTRGVSGADQAVCGTE